MGPNDWAALGVFVTIFTAWIGHLHRRVNHGLSLAERRFSKMPIDYMPRDQVNDRLKEHRELIKDGFSSIEGKLDKIFDKLDGKADK